MKHLNPNFHKAVISLVDQKNSDDFFFISSITLLAKNV